MKENVTCGFSITKYKPHKILKVQTTTVRKYRLHKTLRKYKPHNRKEEQTTPSSLAVLVLLFYVFKIQRQTLTKELQVIYFQSPKTCLKLHLKHSTGWHDCLRFCNKSQIPLVRKYNCAEVWICLWAADFCGACAQQEWLLFQHLPFWSFVHYLKCAPGYLLQHTKLLGAIKHWWGPSKEWLLFTPATSLIYYPTCHPPLCLFVVKFIASDLHWFALDVLIQFGDFNLPLLKRWSDWVFIGWYQSSDPIPIADFFFLCCKTLIVMYVSFF